MTTSNKKVTAILQKIRMFSGTDGLPNQRTVRGLVRTASGGRKLGRALGEFTKLLGACCALHLRGVSSACAPGCHQCCYTMPWVWMTAERELIQTALRQDRGLADRVYSVTRPIVREWGALRKHFGIEPQQGSSASFDRAWEELLFPCPFLDTESGLCLIYKVRPIECRLTIADQICEHPSREAVPVFPPLYGIEEEDLEPLNLEGVCACKAIFDTVYPMLIGQWVLGTKDPLPHWDILKRHAVDNVLITIGYVDKWLYNKSRFTPIPLIHVIPTI